MRRPGMSMAGRPGDGVGTIAWLLEKWMELALCGKLAASILKHHDVARLNDPEHIHQQ